jgi:hypothetical protein
MAENKTKNTAIELPNGVTEDMVKAWKERYGDKKIKLATLSNEYDSFEPFDVVVRVPGRVERSEFEKWVDRNPDKAKEVLVKSCLLSHKDEVLANEDMFLSAFDSIAGLLPVAKAVIKNL